MADSIRKKMEMVSGGEEERKGNEMKGKAANYLSRTRQGKARCKSESVL